MTTVVLAEKPSVARDIAAFLGCRGKRDGYFEGGDYQVTWALGHLVGLKDPGDYDASLKPWQLQTLPFVPERFLLKQVGDQRARKQLAVVKRLFKAADRLICATDAGREGELIFRYILTLTGCTRTPFDRLWLSSLTRQALRHGFAHLKPGREYDRLYAAAKCRSEGDWIVGMNATRCYTVCFGDRRILWSVGRVQTPVLAMIVRRDDEIRRFRPEPFWELFTAYRGAQFKYAGDRFTAEADAAKLLSRITGHPFRITRVQAREEALPPPLLYDLTELQRDMNRRFGLSADATLKAAQKLYEDKRISYPRTDSRYLSADMKREIPRTLEKLAATRPDAVAKLDLGNLRFSRRIVNDAKVTDHHALIPTGKDAGGVSGPAANVYDAIVTRFIAVFYADCLRHVTKVEGETNAVPFRARGVTVVRPGWTALYPKKLATTPRTKTDGAEPKELPAFRQGESGDHRPRVKDGMTQPPKHYTENTLLGAMETAGKQVDDEQLREAMKTRGLGTPATRAAIIETLLNRQYIRREKKTLQPTDSGRFLIAIIRDPSLTSAELTGEWEYKLACIQRGTSTPNSFMADIRAFTESIIAPYRNRDIDPRHLGSCPLCGQAVIHGREGYGCSAWRTGCPFVLWPEHDGCRFTAADIRTLLQHRTLGREVTIAGQSVLVAMNDRGEIVTLHPPTAANRGGSSGNQRRGRTSHRRPAARRQSHTPAGNRGAAGQPPTDGESLGACPACGQPVVETQKAYGCSAWRGGCRFAVWKRIAGKSISRGMAKSLLGKGETRVLKGFKSKAGKDFEAALKVVDGKVEMAFPEA